MNRGYMKNIWWWHFLKSKRYWPYRFTLKRLEKIKEEIMQDEDFWTDILDRHNAADEMPDEMANRNLEKYNHCMGNMAGMLCQTMIEKGILKGGK